jgi:hypothetical protein
MKLARRTLLSGLTGGAGTAVATYVGSRLSPLTFRPLTDFLRPPQDRIRRTFSGLKFAPDAISKYLADWERHHPGKSSDAFRTDARFFQRFLMSTDFFQNGRATNRVISYVTYYDPYVTPCYNPLLRRFSSATRG